MTRSLPLDFLLISTKIHPELQDCVAALNPLRLGTIELQREAEVSAGSVSEGERVRLGRIIIKETLGRATAILVFDQYATPLMNGMAPHALDGLVSELEPQWQHIVRAGTLSVDVQIISSETDNQWRLAWATTVLQTIANTYECVAFDPIAQRCLNPLVLNHIVQSRSLLDHVTLRNEQWGPETRWLYTLGMQKFGQPELEMVAIPQLLINEATNIIRMIAETLTIADASEGPVLRSGMLIDCEGAGWLLAKPALREIDRSAPYGHLRLVTAPQPGDEVADDATEVIALAAIESARLAMQRREWQSANAILQRVLTELPGYPAALMAMGRVFLSQGSPQDALDTAESLSLYAPQDYRGSYLLGLALMAMGRVTESLGALNRAATLNPNDAEVFLTRARIHERLGFLTDAATDRAHALILDR